MLFSLYSNKQGLFGNSVSWERPASLMEELDSEDIQKGI